MDIVYYIAGRASETEVLPCAVQIDYPYVTEQMFMYVSAHVPFIIRLTRRIHVVNK